MKGEKALNITQHEAEVIRSALTSLMNDSNKENYAAVLEKLALTPSVNQLGDLEGFMNAGVEKENHGSSQLT